MAVVLESEDAGALVVEVVGAAVGVLDVGQLAHGVEVDADGVSV